MPPWSTNVGIDAAISEVEQVARDHGFAGTRARLLRESDVLGIEQRVGLAIPTDLRRFLGWYSDIEWSWFVNPERQRLSDRVIVNAKGEIIAQDHPDDDYSDLFGLCDADQIAILKFENCADRYLKNFFEQMRDRGTGNGRWSGASVLCFGSSQYGETIYYALNTPSYPAGAILAGTDDDPGVVWLADSLPQWLTRLVCFDGAEFAFAPGDLPQNPSGLEASFVREWRMRNPGSSYFRTD